MVTMQDIATRAGVNRGTVSYVLNDKHKQARIGKQTCLRVKNIADELGYCRNELARSVVTGKSNVLAFVSCDTGSWEYTAKIMAGIVEELTKQKFSLKVYHLTEDNSSEITKQIISQRVAGVIFHAPLNIDFQTIHQAMQKNHIPCATVNLTSKHVAIGVTTDDAQGVKDAVKYLAELGHQRILYLSNKKFSRAEYVIHREAGYLAGMEKYISKSIAPRIEFVLGEYSTDKSIIKRILNEPIEQRPTAIICINDTTALEIFQVAYQLNIKIPEKLSIIGFADLDMAKYAMVPLTTIAQPFEQMGQKIAELLLERTKNRQTDSSAVKNLTLPTKLVIRQSTKAIN